MKRLLLSFISTSLFVMATTAHAETITVSAAASLTDAFNEIGTVFKEKHPGNDIDFNYAASGALLQQIIQGAPVDVFASADQETMNKAQTEGVIKKETRANFIGNGLVLITPIDSNLSFNTLNDLSNENIKHIAMGNPDTTPNARYAKAAMEQAGVWKAIESKVVQAANVRQSLNYVSRGEVEAGFVFSTDAKHDEGKVKVALTIPTVSAGKKEGEWIPSPIIYPIAEITQSNKPLASEFIKFILSSEGQTILAKYGFSPIKEMNQ